MSKLFKNKRWLGYIIECLLIVALISGGFFLLWSGFTGAVDFAQYEYGVLFKRAYMIFAIFLISVSTYFISYKIPNVLFPLFTFICLISFFLLMGGSFAYDMASQQDTGMNMGYLWIGFDISALNLGINVRLIIDALVYGAIGILVIIGMFMMYYADSSGEKVKVLIEFGCVIGGAVIFAQYVSPMML